MTVINIDKLIETRKKFIIAGKEVEVIFNDKTTKLISDVHLEVSELIKRSTDIEKLEEVDTKTLEVQKAYVNNIFKEMKQICSKLFDAIVEEGEGERIYNFYDGSTQALATIIRVIDEHNQVYKEQNYQNAKNKYKKKK
ncbi:hypothetical protein [Lactococcus lactis]|uniref:Phage protein n=1 Tax=Lactococcus lactis TaxID=1358 RepID=A0AAW5TN57_9LACT|nr:hypothetical protein [Lactococcus lactis]MCW2281421.1 hypothetical protein [Lactococcus lactis]MCW2281439.1 hypothetical protein [Lactococcus lactis]MCW2282173.1 hypothetical protein [Lactococcus lactis]